MQNPKIIKLPQQKKVLPHHLAVTKTKTIKQSLNNTQGWI
jgi:hypothetical protein